VEVGQAKRDHVRRAVQAFSEGTATTRTVYAHLGWRDFGDCWGDLHARGAIGPEGPLADVSVSLTGALGRFELPDPPEGERLIEAVRASLAILGTAPEAVTVPLLGAVYRAPLPVLPGEAGLYFVGPSGSGKTALAALAQQHFGPGLDARHLPGNWNSTANALEGLLFAAAHAVVVVDDFAPNGSKTDVDRLHGTAEKLIRGAGNRAGRQRMWADGTLRAERPPRALLLATGEDTPRGHSVRARLTIVEVDRESVRFDTLGEHQQRAADGRLAEALAGYVRWLARRWGESDLEAAVSADLTAARTSFAGAHRRTPDALASLAVGWRWWVRFATEAGALTGAEGDDLLRRVERTLGAVGEAQSAHHEGSEPAARFLELLGSALASGRAHLASPEGAAPPDGARRWGWRPWGTEGDLRPEGRRIGWVSDDGEVWLEPSASHAAAREMASALGDDLATSERTVRKRLAERGFLAEREEGRQRLTARRTVEGRRLDVLILARGALGAEEPSQPSQPAQPAPDGAEWDGSTVPMGHSESATVPAEYRPHAGEMAPVGRLGRSDVAPPTPQRDNAQQRDGSGPAKHRTVPPNRPSGPPWRCGECGEASAEPQYGTPPVCRRCWDAREAARLSFEGL
jgi:hypothetical protein